MCFRYHICFSSNQNTKYVCTHNIINIITMTRDTKRRKVSPVSVVIARSISSHATATLSLYPPKKIFRISCASHKLTLQRHTRNVTRRRRRKNDTTSLRARYNENEIKWKIHSTQTVRLSQSAALCYVDRAKVSSKLKIYILLTLIARPLRAALCWAHT